MGWPGITELRCNACTLTGGVEVETEETAKELSRMFDREIRVGDFVEEQPCEPPNFPEALRGADGLPCPRTTLRPDNSPAALLVRIACNEEIRHYGAILEPLLTRFDTDQAREDLALRVVNTLTDPDVIDARRRAAAAVARERAREREADSWQ